MFFRRWQIDLWTGSFVNPQVLEDYLSVSKFKSLENEERSSGGGRLISGRGLCEPSNLGDLLSIPKFKSLEERPLDGRMICEGGPCEPGGLGGLLNVPKFKSRALGLVGEIDVLLGSIPEFS